MGPKSKLNTASLPVVDDRLPRSSSLLSRLTAPLRSRTRNLADLHIHLQEPHRKYSVGDRVRGAVVLSLVKPIRVTHLTVALHGFVRAYKNASASEKYSPVNPAPASHAGQHFRYHGNGHAQLFHDEIVLCGEGRLEASRWEFEFDLEFPDLELPSSIDFERGKIAYLVTATLTRPTSIAPTSSCEAQVSLVEKVDVGLVDPPRERKVFLQTMRRRPKKRRSVPSTVPSGGKRQSPALELTKTVSNRASTTAATVEGPNEDAALPGAPSSSNSDSNHQRRNSVGTDAQSEISGESVVSHHSASQSPRTGGASGDSLAESKSSGRDEREITATVEMLKGGCLPGDLVPVKIKVEHNRHMKSLHGIIVTLYRQGRVDYAPPISSFKGISREDAKKLEPDEYYPKSKTGLGGLSLSSAGSCSVFRKDLSQTVTPLYINPSTLTATTTTAVRVPENAFPSIRNVPGGLVNFRYYIEVIVDLGGKLAGQSAVSSPVAQPTRMTAGSAGSAYGVDLSSVASWSGAVVETDHLRREKGVISVCFELVVGSVDSSRLRGKAVAPTPLMTPASPQEEQHCGGQEYDYEEWPHTYHDAYTYQEEVDAEGHQRSDQDQPSQVPPHTSFHDFQDHNTQAPHYIPPPVVPDESTLTEKERIRRAEERLLPSQPPQQPAGASVSDMPDINAERSVPAPHAPTVPSLPGHLGESDGFEPSAPTLENLSSQIGTASQANTDDKQELERRRLLAEASAPPEMPDDMHRGEPSGPSQARPALSGAHAPSAPILDEETEYGNRARRNSAMESADGTGHHEQLPRYERYD